MGQDIGFNLYEKKPFDENGLLVLAKKDGVEIDAGWVSGRTESTCSWGNLFEFGDSEEIVPVFQKELDGKSRGDDYHEVFKFCKFDYFKDEVMGAIDKDLAEATEQKRAISKRILAAKSEIEELRELQKSCTEEQSYAFDRWNGEISDKKEAIASSEEYLASYDAEDYEYLHAIAVKELLTEMEKYVEEGEYYVIPFFSY